jgi:two-component system nitrate/nitrite response regulator NarL
MLVDDHPVVIEGLKASLKNYNWIDIVAIATSGKEALAKIEMVQPQIVLLDIALPDITGVKIAEEARNGQHVPAIIAYTMYNDIEYLKLLVRAGAKGFLLKEGSVEELINALDAVAKGGTYFSPRVTGSLLEGIFSGASKKTNQNDFLDQTILTSREREIIILIAKGEKNKTIAEKLGLNPRTVETHRRNLMLKLGIHSAAGLTRFAIEKDLV